MPLTPPALALEDVARGAPLDLDLDHDGTPQRPVVVVDLDSRPVVGAAVRISEALPVVIGVSRGGPDQVAGAACDVVLFATGRPAAPTGIAVEDVDASIEALVGAIERAPRAAVALSALLRQTADQPDVRAALLAESAVYSTLLAGPEHAGWLRARGPARPVIETDTVRVAREGDVLRVTLCRPARRNAVTAALRDALVDALAIAHADPSLTVDIDAEGPDFSTGGDLDEFGTAPDVATAHLVRSDRSVGWAIHQIRDRVRVRVHGRAQGSGVEMPAFAGRVAATADATFALPELSLGLVPGAGGTVSVTRRIGRWRTAWLALSGASIDVTTALAWGLVDERA